MNEELRELVRNRMKESMKDLNPLVEQFIDIITSAYEKGFFTGFNIGLSVEKKED